MSSQSGMMKLGAPDSRNCHEHSISAESQGSRQHEHPGAAVWQAMLWEVTVGLLVFLMLPSSPPPWGFGWLHRRWERVTSQHRSLQPLDVSIWPCSLTGNALGGHCTPLLVFLMLPTGNPQQTALGLRVAAQTLGSGHTPPLEPPGVPPGVKQGTGHSEPDLR